MSGSGVSLVNALGVQTVSANAVFSADPFREGALGEIWLHKDFGAVVRASEKLLRPSAVAG